MFIVQIFTANAHVPQVSRCVYRMAAGTHQFAVVVFAVSAVLDVVCIRSLFLAQQPSELSAAACMKNRTRRRRRRRGYKESSLK